MQLTVTAASWWDVWAALSAAHPGGVRFSDAQGTLMAWRLGPAWAWREASATADYAPPICCAGIVLDGGVLRVWFVAGDQAGRHMVPLVRGFRRILDAAQSLHGLDATTDVAASNPAGRRLSRAVGFRACGAAGPVQTWRRSVRGQDAQEYFVRSRPLGGLDRARYSSGQ